MSKPTLHIHSVSFEHGDEIWHGVKGGYKKLEREFKSLSRRALLMAGPEDVVISDDTVDEKYISLLRDLGVGGAEIQIPSHRSASCLVEDVAMSPELVDFIKSWGGATEVYMPSPADGKLSEKTGRSLSPTPFGVATALNDKVFFTRLLEDIDAPKIETVIGNSNAMAGRLNREPDKKAIVRGARSVGGSMVFPVRNKNERARTLKVLNKITDERLFIFQPFIESAETPNLQFYVGEKDVTLFGETIQALGPLMGHVGNLFDRSENKTARNLMIKWGVALAMESASLGYRGVLGIDFIVTKDGNVYPIEMNARHNTSTHALWFVNRLITKDPMIQAPSGMAAYFGYSVSRSLSASEWLDALGSLAFNTSKMTGILPYDINGTTLHAVIVGTDHDDRVRLIEGARNIAARI